MGPVMQDSASSACDYESVTNQSESDNSEIWAHHRAAVDSLVRSPPLSTSTSTSTELQVEFNKLVLVNMSSDHRVDAFIEELTVFEPLSELKGSKIAVEARWYLQKFLDSSPAKEPLVSALGGLPFALKSHFEADLEKWKTAGVTPLFVFEGLSLYGEDEISLKTAKDASASIQEGWTLYTAGTPNEAVAAFGSSGAIQAKDFYRFFQKILHDRKLHYEIAAYSAAGHIAEMDAQFQRADGTQTCEMVMGSYELLLFPLSTALITKIDFDRETFHGINRYQLLESLNVVDDVLIDALLMTGNSFLPAFPPLKEIVTQQPYTIKDAVNMYRTAEKSTVRLCDQWSEVLQKQQEPHWLDKYRKARLVIKHNIRVTREKKNFRASVTVNNFESLTGDHHEYIGLQLPQELYHYMIHGGIGPRIMNWLVYLKMLVPPPLDGGDSEEYRQLITKQLVPVRAQTIALYTSRLHRAFQHKPFSMLFWFDSNATVEVNHQSVQPSPESLAATWRVTEKEYEAQLDSTHAKPGSLTFALIALRDEQFARSTISSKSGEKYRIKSLSEIMANTLWRFLHLRGYINEKHDLTVWGKALLTTLSGLNPIHQQEEAAFLAFELLRLDQLNAKNRHDDRIGAPQRGSEEDKIHCLLISRCASLLKIRHKEVGYTGPLSKNLLAYHSIVSAVRETDRDLVEAIIASMFMFADADRVKTRDEGKRETRNRDNADWRNLGFSLPFGTDVDVALGIAVKTWLDDHVKPNLTMEQKTDLKGSYTSQYLPHGQDFTGDLDRAFSFFDALFDGVKTLKGEIAEGDLDIWRGARKYLADRR